MNDAVLLDCAPCTTLDALSWRHVLLSRWRYVAIIHPIKAHIVCNKRRIVVVLGCIWPCAFIAGLPTLIFNDVVQGHPRIPVVYCMIIFPDNHIFYFTIFKYVESVLFYYIPLLIQLTLYAFITRHLFVGTDRLHRRITIRLVNGSSLERFSEALQARRGVVKMLMLSVIVYFVSYSPHQILLISNTISPSTFHQKFSFQVFVMIIANINSAANPVLYSIFSQNFRQCFKCIMCGCCFDQHRIKPRRQSTLVSNTSRTWRHTSYRSATTEFWIEIYQLHSLHYLKFLIGIWLIVYDDCVLIKGQIPCIQF